MICSRASSLNEGSRASSICCRKDCQRSRICSRARRRSPSSPERSGRSRRTISSRSVRAAWNASSYSANNVCTIICCIRSSDRSSLNCTISRRLKSGSSRYASPRIAPMPRIPRDWAKTGLVRNIAKLSIQQSVVTGLNTLLVRGVVMQKSSKCRFVLSMGSGE